MQFMVHSLIVIILSVHDEAFLKKEILSNFDANHPPAPPPTPQAMICHFVFRMSQIPHSDQSELTTFQMHREIGGNNQT